MNPTSKSEESVGAGGATETERAVPAAAETHDAPGPSLAKEPGGSPAADSAGESTTDVTAADAYAGDVVAGEDGESPDEDLDGAYTPSSAGGLAAASAALISVLLSVISLIGTWSGKVVSERETLQGQIELGQTGTAEQQISEIYGDAWHAVALTNGVFAALALAAGLLAFGFPQRTSWVRPFAVAGLVLAFLGLLVSLGMYFDLFLSLPEPPDAPQPAG
ncbi:hypothetical protein OG875_07640 [Streptomyces sp. NBC_01498]|uniref:hypothetical protein n=1 Tax=Streptomyces sp. NBC_01498 TaxID=2975870 RepID=UPI002E7BD98B|nr:hypothetical protein [Streptomyces sp. NBC_01498]WTL24484.1 hypothetical protein OG875_07640 [Streptomyces sp. NBC_01498]